MEIILTILYISIFIFIIYKFEFFKINELSRKTISIIFLFKILCGIIFFWIYTFYYADRANADIYKYFDDSKVMHEALSKHPLDFFKMITGIKNDNAYFDKTYYFRMNNWYRKYESNVFNDNHIIIRFNAIVRIFSFGYYQVHNVFINFFSLLGLVALFKFFISNLNNKKPELIFVSFLIPSVLFWGSGLLKEGLLIFGLGFLLYYFDLFIKHERTFKSIFWILFSIIILRFTKVYILIILIPLLISFYWTKITFNRNVFLKYISIITVYIFFLLSLKYISPRFDVLGTIADKQINFINMSRNVNAGSFINLNILKPDLTSFLINFPKAFYNTLFRPWFFESSSPLSLMSGIENLFIILIGIISIIFIKIKDVNKNLFFFSLFFVLLTFTLIGLATPVIGAIVRYKIPALPFLMVIFIMLMDKERIFKKFKIHSKNV